MNKSRIYIGIFWVALIFSCLSNELRGQSGFNFKPAHGTPVTQSIKFDDIYFLDDATGMTCNGDGRIYKTTDSGYTWNLIHDNPGAYFRCIVMTDSLNAWVGNYGVFPGSAGDPTPLFHTADGGNSWQPVAIPSSPQEFGVCGLFRIGTDYIYGVGRIQGPAIYIRSVDGGQNWTFTDMSSYAGFLVDCYFLSPDTGFAVGGSDDDLALATPVILKTTNGGVTWQVVYNGAGNYGSWCWKIHFTGKLFYVSVESDASPVICLKSFDRGNTWQIKIVSNGQFNQQAIGFVNDTIGWTGGYAGSHVHETTDGGNTWTALGVHVENLNRIRRMNDSLLWASGLQIYKISKDSVQSEPLPAASFEWSIQHCHRQHCAVISIKDNRPNKRYHVEVFDVVGRKVYESAALPYQEVDLRNISTTLLYFVLSDGEQSYCRNFLNY